LGLSATRQILLHEYSQDKSRLIYRFLFGHAKNQMQGVVQAIVVDDQLFLAGLGNSDLSG
jgi:hypothetical protein